MKVPAKENILAKHWMLVIGDGFVSHVLTIYITTIDLLTSKLQYVMYLTYTNVYNMYVKLLTQVSTDRAPLSLRKTSTTFDHK